MNAFNNKLGLTIGRGSGCMFGQFLGGFCDRHRVHIVRRSGGK